MLTLIFVSSLCGPALRGGAAEPWSRFQNGGAALSSAQSLPLEWSEDRGVAWQKGLAGYGQSSPVSDGRRLYVTSVSGDEKQHVHLEAFLLESGERAWHFEGANSSPEKNTSYVSRAAPTPVCDAQGVIALFEGGNLVAFNTDGQVRWQRDLVKEHGPITARHGLASSLEQSAKHVFVWIERETSPYLLAIDPSSGTTSWKSEGLGVTSWSSPRLVPVGDGRQHLVLSGSGKVAGLDPATGERLWLLEGLAGNTTTTPFPVGEGRFLLGASEGRGEAAADATAPSNGLVSIERREDGKFEATFQWRAERATSSFGTPVALGKRAYFVNRVGAVYCLDVETGKQIFAARSAGSIWATPLVAENRIYLFGRNGVTTVLGSGDAYEVAAENSLWKQAPAAEGPGGPGFGGPVLYAAIAVNNRLVVRRGDRLYVIARLMARP